MQFLTLKLFFLNIILTSLINTFEMMDDLTYLTMQLL
jgi:hypothetical protein